MTDIRKTLIGLCVAATSLGAMAQTADEHKAHHPADASAPAAAVKSTAKSTSAKPQSAAIMTNMDQHMKAMQSMHEKMMGAKTPEERQALMAEHMKLMQDSMSMMQDMHGQGGMSGDMANRQQLMEKRMDMMESMMQMMMDCMPADANRAQEAK